MGLIASIETVVSVLTEIQTLVNEWPIIAGSEADKVITPLKTKLDELWVVFMNDTTEFWTVSNKEIRAQFNQSLGRRQTEIKVSNY